ncbi:hypothetical protein DL96DRAFT_701414 [Flagelloscypha sp. PMI_526]|nr:hypothetical protein DL96DRAFT_701414 [Flagelloscypha sp. PMI_526]
METLQCPHCSETLAFKDFVTTTTPLPIVPEELLQSNQLLAGFNSHSIHNNIEVATRYLQSVETVLARVDLLRNDLEKARNQTQNHIAQQRECAGIGRGLPLDILRNIFELVTEFFPYDTDLSGNRCATVVQLSSVSRTWRKVLLQFPFIWSSIAVPFSYSSEVLAGFTPLLDSFLMRSGDSPLRIAFHFPDTDDTHDENIWNEYIRAFRSLANHSNRWEELVLEGISYELLDTLFPLPSIPRLKSIMVETNKGPFSFPKSLIPHAPSLQSVQWEGVELSPTILPWFQLRKLELEFIDSPFQEILALLPDMINLEELTLDRARNDELFTNDIPHPGVKLANLTLLTINFAHPFPLDAFILPHLRKFVLDRSWEELPSSHIDALGRFLARTKSLEEAKLSSPFHILGSPGMHFPRRLVLDLVCDSPVTPEGSGVASLSYACLSAHFPYLEYLEVYCEEDGNEKEGDLDRVVDIAKALVAICRARNNANDKLVPELFLGEISARFVVGTSPIVFEKLVEIRKEALEFPRFTHFQVLKE